MFTANPQHNSKDQLYIIENKVVKLHNDQAKIMSEAIYETKQGTGLKT